MAVLVTGAFGFIGKEVVRQLTARGDRVVALDVDGPFFPVKDQVVVETADVTAESDVDQIFDRYPIQRVIHLAYAMDIWGAHPKAAIKTNIIGFQNIVETCLKHSVQRLVWGSSVMVYGRPAEYEVKAVNEQVAHNPHTFYGKCKVFNEFLAGHYRRISGLDHVCLRLTTVYGPGRYARGAAGFIYDCAYGAATGEPVRVDEKASTDLVYVEDAARAFLLAMDVAEPSHRVFNVGGYEVNAESLISLLNKFAETRIKAELKSEENNFFPSKVDRELARRFLGYEPPYDLEQGLQKYLSSFDPSVALTR